MLKFHKKKVARKKFYGVKKAMKILDTDDDNVVIWKLIETKNNSKYLVWYLGEVMRLLVLSLTKKSRYIKNLKDKKIN